MMQFYHKIITQSALGQYVSYGISQSALDFIKRANTDSDTDGYDHNPQHFCFTGNNNDFNEGQKKSIRDGLDFTSRALALAIDYIFMRKMKKDEIFIGLYFFGRACHCIQDFYSHSNWIFLEQNADMWDGKDTVTRWRNVKDEVQNIPKVIKVCKESPMYRIFNKEIILLFNPGTYRNISHGVFKYKKGLEDILASETIVHPRMHLDYPDSYASLVHFWTRGYIKGYTRASECAKTHTKDLWKNLVCFQDKEKLEKLRKYSIPVDMISSHKSDWEDLRYMFNTEMQIS